MYVNYEENLNPIFKDYLPIMKVISGQFGNQCEVVLHDFSNYTSSIVAIVGNITDRKLHAPLTDFVIEILRNEGDDAEDRIGYMTYFKGKPFRCSTTFIRDGSQVIGCMCINYCVQDYFTIKKMADPFITAYQDMEAISEVKQEYFAQSIDDFVENTIQKVLADKGEDLTRLTKPERIDLIGELEQKGVFLVKGTVETLAERMNISKYTIYNYIEEVKK